MEPSQPSKGKASQGRSIQIVESLADVTAAGLPLTDGLRAVAAESGNRRLARDLELLARRLEQGQSLDEAIADSQLRLPKYLAGLVRASAATGDLSGVLLELLEHQQSIRELWRYTWSAMTYPVILLSAAFALFLGLELFILPPLAAMFQDFDIDLPDVTLTLIWIFDEGLWWLLATAVITLLGLLVFRLVGGAARWRQALCSVPLLGVLWQWAGTAELARLLSILTAQGIPAPQALRLASDGVRDANFSRISWTLAANVEAGQSLSDAAAAEPGLPGSLVPILRWGEQAGDLPDAFRTVGTVFEGRMRLRSELLRSVVPPVVFVAIGMLALVAFFGLYAPMLTMIRGMMFW